MLLKIRLTFAGNWHYNETMIEELTIEETKIEEEESSILSKAIVTAKSYDWVEEESLAIILRRPLANLQLCGKSQLDWVKLACGKMQKVVLDEFCGQFEVSHFPPMRHAELSAVYSKKVSRSAGFSAVYATFIARAFSSAKPHLHKIQSTPTLFAPVMS